MLLLGTILLLLVYFTGAAEAVIDRRAIVSRFNPRRNASSSTTPMQVGNGNFAFGADVTGMQTFLPFNTMSSWGWKNDSLPEGRAAADVESYHGVSWDNHGRPVEYDFGGPPDLEQWLISNPNRVNLARIGLAFLGTDGEVSEDDLVDKSQVLDLWTGVITSSFTLDGSVVSIQTVASQDSSAVAFTISSDLLRSGTLGVFLDLPWNDGKAKFSAPFVGSFNQSSLHDSSLVSERQVVHETDGSQVFIALNGNLNVTRDSPDAHRYTLIPLENTTTFSFSATLSTGQIGETSDAKTIMRASKVVWEDYWTKSGFVDILSASTDSRAEELQRRIILSRYLMRVNEAGDTPPQESGLVNNGWYGKFHMEMYFWHSAHWALWNNWDILSRSSSIYSRFLPSSIVRAQVQQGFSAGARWPKMTDPSGRSSPGEINNLLLWQQPHPLVFAQYEYRAFPTRDALEKWRDVVKETADFMVAFAWRNESSGFYDLGPPMYVVSEDTAPNDTRNAAFELAYWRLGLGLAEDWMKALGEDVPEAWAEVKDNLAPLPVDNGTYSVYEGLESTFWTDPEYTNDHPALVGLYGWLPETDGLDLSIAADTTHKVRASWNLTKVLAVCRWDFPMLAMSAARLGDPDTAVDWLLDPLFELDDVGMPVGGVRVPTPYFPGAGGLLYAIAFMAAGWDGSDGQALGFPNDGWSIAVEGIIGIFLGVPFAGSRGIIVITASFLSILWERIPPCNCSVHLSVSWDSPNPDRVVFLNAY